MLIEPTERPASPNGVTDAPRAAAGATSRSTARRRRWLRGGAVVIALAAALMLGLGLVPVHLSATVQRSSSPLVQVFPGSAPAPERDGVLDTLAITVTAVEPPAQARLPMTVTGAQVQVQDLGSSRDWILSSGGSDRLQALASGAVFELTGGFTSLDLPFDHGPDAGTVEIVVNGRPQVVDLAAPTTGVTTVRITSRYVTQTLTERFGWTSHAIEIAEPLRDPPRASLGLVSIETTTTEDSNGTSQVSVSRSDVIAGVMQALQRALPILLAAVALVALAYVAGVVLETFVGLERHPVLGTSLARRLVVGASLPLLVAGALNYVVPGWMAGAIVGAALVALALVAIRAGRLRAKVLAPPRRISGWISAGVVAVAIATPIVFSSGQSLGFLQTDAYLYTGLVETFWQESAVTRGSEFGNGLRLLDFTARSLVHGTMNLDPVAAIHALRLAMAVVLALALDELAIVLRIGARLRILLVASIAISAPLISLWAEAYLSREFFVVAALMGLAVTAVAYSERLSKRGLFLAGATLAVPAAIVPGFMTLAIAAVLALVPLHALVRPRHLGEHGRQVFARAGMYSAGLALFALPNLIWLRRLDVSTNAAKYVNPIGKAVVIPFHDTAAYPQALFGGIPLHNHRRAPLGPEVGRWVPRPLTELRELLDGQRASIFYVIAIAALALVAAVVALCIARRSSEPGFRRVVGLVTLTLAVTVVLFFPHLLVWDTQAYLVLMYPWTLSPLAYGALLLLLAVAATQARSRAWRLALGAGLAGIMAVNAASAVLESSRWLESPTGVLAPRWHYDLGEDLLAVDGLLDQRSDLETAALEIDVSELAYHDTWVVLANHISQRLGERGIACLNCRPNERLGAILERTVPAAQDVTDVTVAIGATNCDGQVLLRTRHLVMCERDH